MLVTLICMVTKITRSRGIFLLAFLGIVVALAAALFTLQSSPSPGESSEDPNQEQGVENVNGTWGSKANRGPYLEFKEDDSLVGHDGCNGFSGRFTLSDDGQTVVIHDLLGTLKACPGVDTWLRNAQSAVIDGDTLVIFDKSSEEIGRLQQD